MQLAPLDTQTHPATSRFTRRPDEYLAGEARPGDVLALAGGGLVRDTNANGRVDRLDVIVDDRGLTARFGQLIDLRG